MIPQGNKRHRDVTQPPKAEASAPTHKQIHHPFDSEDGSFSSEFEDISDDLDDSSIVYDTDLEEMEEEEDDELYDLMEGHSGGSSGLMDYTCSTDPMDISEFCNGDKVSTIPERTTKAIKEADFNQSMETLSCGDTVSSDMSIDPDWIDTDDEEAMEEYLVYKEARRRQQNLVDEQCTSDVQRELEDYDDIDAINIRYWIQGSTATNGKPCTMTSSVGPVAAVIDMRRNVMSAQEMLRNYFRSTEPNRTVGRSKENACASKNMVASRVKGRSNRIALSEKN